jgi:hypothetical protein
MEIIYKDTADGREEFYKNKGIVYTRDSKPVTEEGLYYKIVPPFGKRIVIVDATGKITGEQG